MATKLRRVSDWPTKLLPAAVKQFTKKRTARVVVVEPGDPVRMYDLDWGGGTRNEYAIQEFALPGVPRAFGERVAARGNDFTALDHYQGRGEVVVEHGFFCGRPRQITVYVREDDLAAFAPAFEPATAVPPLYFERAKVLPPEVLKDWCEDEGLDHLADTLTGLLWPKEPREYAY